MSPDEVKTRMNEMMQFIDGSIMLADPNEILMLACAMLTKCKDIFDQQLGEEGRKGMFKDFC